MWPSAVGKIQNETHETLRENHWQQQKTSPMRQNGAALRFELYAYHPNHSIQPHHPNQPNNPNLPNQPNTLTSQTAPTSAN